MPDERCLLDPTRDCYGIKEAQRVEKRLESLEDRNGKDHRDFRESISGIQTLTNTLGAQFTTILQTMGEIKQSNEKLMEAVQALKPKAEAADKLGSDMEELEKKVEEIESKPAKNWEELKGKLLWGIVGVFAAALGAGIIRLLSMGT